MTDLNLEGIFWCQSDAQDQVAGRLTFNESSGATLDLLGAFSEMENIFEDSVEPLTIHGAAGGKLLTLVNCLRTHSSLNIPGIFREEYKPFTILAGCHIAEDQPLAFEAVHITLRHLDEWVGKTGTNVTITPGDSNSIEKVVVTHQPLDKQSIPTEFGSLELRFKSSFKLGTLSSTEISEETFLAAKFNELQPLENIFRICTALRNLVTVAIGAPAVIYETTVRHPSFMNQVGDSSPFPVPIEMYTKWSGVYSADESVTVHPAEMLFTYDDIGGLAGVAKWVDISESYASVIRSLLSHWYIPETYVENRVQSACTAAEQFYRVHSSVKGRINLRQALEELVLFVGKPFGQLVHDPELWSREVTKRRQAIVHRGELGNYRDQILAESVYYLVVLSLLRNCEVPAKALSNVGELSGFIRLKKRLQEAL